jgi:lipopolysaccharide/colanic/teichoic acid biosynthesis glycosyltransferase
MSSRPDVVPSFPLPVDAAPATAQPKALTSIGKRALDVVVALVLIVLTSPIWIVAAIRIRATSPGPILFRQERVGAGGKVFTCYKFRTMTHGASDAPHRQLVQRMLDSAETSGEAVEPYKVNGDVRIIPAARWLRRTSLDELPQLINVLRGEMSIVGPRPPLQYEVERYDRWHHERLTVRPGITGLWQVSGRNRLTYHEMCALDLEYIRGWSLWNDIVIMARTPWVMFVDRGGAS